MKCATFSGMLFFALAYYSQWEYHHFYPGQYNFSVTLYPLYSKHLLSGLAGILISPSRGLFIFSPIFVLTFAGSIYYFKSLYRNPLFWTGITWFILHIYLISCWGMWWGSGSFGYRLLTDILPALILLSILVVKQFPHQITELSRPLCAVIILVGLFCILVNTGQGLYNKNTAKWNGYPNIDRNQEYLWDWKYPQFLATHASLEKRFSEHISRQPIGTVKILGVIKADSEDGVFVNWSGYEQQNRFRWSDGKRVSIRLDIDGISHFENSYDLQLRLTAGTYKAQSITVRINDHEAGKIETDFNGSIAEYVFPISKSMLEKNFQAGTISLVVEFHIPGAISPSEIEGSNSKDPRVMGISFYELKLEAVKGQ